MKFFLVTLLCVCSVILFGQGIIPPGLGTEEDPYLMSEFDHLVWFSETEEVWGSYFLQTADIDASESSNVNDVDECLNNKSDCGRINVQVIDGQVEVIVPFGTVVNINYV